MLVAVLSVLATIYLANRLGVPRTRRVRMSDLLRV